MKNFKCENCGSDLINNADGTYSCKYCKRTYGDDRLERAYERLYRDLSNTVQGFLSEELLKQKLQTISNCRQTLYKSLTGAYLNNAEVGKWSGEILALAPEDPQANFYSLAAKGEWGELNKFMNKVNAREISHLIEGFVDYLTNGRFVEECMLDLTDLIDRAFLSKSKQYADCHKKISRAAENERNGIFDVGLSRDVFVAYSSKDKEQAYELVEKLEENGFTCFIAMRNLAKGVDAELYYNERLKKAMDNCKVFVLVSSRNSRSRTCDAYRVEMKYVKERDVAASENPDYARAHYELYLEKNRKKCKPRVEYLIEEYGPSVYEQEVKKFFGGLTWCLDMDSVVSAVFDYVENFQAEEVDEQSELMQRLMTEIQARHAKIQETKNADFSIENGELKEYKKDEEEAIIPEGVTSIGDNAFEYKENLRKVTIPEGVVRIGENAFRDCKRLGGVVFPSTLKEIGARAFYGCLNLRNIQWPTVLTEIGNSAFCGCNSLKEIQLPTGLEKLGNAIFQDCENLQSCVIPDGWTEIPQGFVGGCKKLERIRIPQSVTKMGSHVFNGCVALSEVEMPNTVLEIGDSAFSNCTGITEIKLPTSLQKLGGFAFSECSKLKKIDLPDGITKINNYTFYRCEELEEVRLPSKLRSIGEVAFSNCKKLSKLSIPDTITEIFSSSFGYCTSLPSNYYGGGYYYGNEKNKYVVLNAARFDEHGEYVRRLSIHENVKVIPDGVFANTREFEEIIVEGSSSPYKSIDGNLYSKDGTRLICYVAGKKDTKFKVPDGVIEIVEGAFKNASNLEEVEFPHGLKKIGAEAFSYCENLREFHAPDTLTYLGARAFYNCSTLKIATVPKDMEKFATGVFQSCYKLEEFEVPNGVDWIGNDDFNYCWELKKLVIPKGVKGISNASSFKNTTIYARAESKPKDWSGDSELNIVWGYKDE